MAVGQGLDVLWRTAVVFGRRRPGRRNPLYLATLDRTRFAVSDHSGNDRAQFETVGHRLGRAAPRFLISTVQRHGIRVGDFPPRPGE
jgi:hypothetical protein